MPFRIDSYSSHDDLEKEGSWCLVYDRDRPDAPPGRVKVRRSNYLPFKRAIEKRQFRGRRSGQEMLLTDFAVKEQPALIGEHLVVDWEGMLDASDNEVPFSQEAAIRACRSHPEFAELLILHAQDRANYLPEGEGEGDENEDLPGKLRPVSNFS